MIHHGDCVEVMAAMEPESVDAIVTDPPYGLEFMGKEWDRLDRNGAASFEQTEKNGPPPFVHNSTGELVKSPYIDRPRWSTDGEVLTVPLADPGNRTGAVQVFGEKTLADRERFQQAQRESIERANTMGRWPANIVLSDPILEPGVPGVVIAQSLTDTMTAWQSWSSEDSGELPTPSPVSIAGRRSSRTGRGGNSRGTATDPVGMQLGAWVTPTDTPKPDTGCSDGTMEDGGSTSGNTATSGSRPTDQSPAGTSSTTRTGTGSTTDSTTSSSSPAENTPHSTSLSEPGSDEQSAYEILSDDSANWRRNSPSAEEPDLTYSRYFLIPKADRADREPVLTPDGHDKARRFSTHPTVKPTDLMRHLVRLVTPAGGRVLDPFLGSGTTGLAAEMEGFEWVGIEREEEYVRIAEARLNGTQKGLGI